MSTSNSDDSDAPDKTSTVDESDARVWSDEYTESGSDSDDEADGVHETQVEAKKRTKKQHRHHQSDTETRNLLDDVGGLDDDGLDLEETKENNALEMRLFEISDEQLEHYTNCFLHLQRRTQCQASVSGAVSGSEQQVIDFFRKSKLDSHALSRVWALADVNEDGYLNHAEFVIAMHLIVLHVKGNVPIPSCLPSPVRPCCTPVRTSAANPEFHNSTASSSNNGGLVADNNSLSIDSAGSRLRPQEGDNVRAQSLSDDYLQTSDKVMVTDFSDAPPVLVDNRPQALNAQTDSKGLALLNSLSSKGPPPQPPSRDYHNAKGHGRSASLDLKAFAGAPLFPGYA